MDECLLLVVGTWILVEGDVACCELVAPVARVHDDGVTVTVTVACGHLLQIESSGCARGAAAASPSRDDKKIFECILPKKRKYKKDVLKIVCLKTLITRIRSLRE